MKITSKLLVLIISLFMAACGGGGGTEDGEDGDDIFEFDVSNTAQWNAAIGAIKAGGSGTAGNPKEYSINITGTVTAPTVNSLSTLKYIVVTLAGSGTLTSNGTGSFMIIHDYQKLIIDGPTLKGVGSNKDYWIDVYGQYSELELKAGAITGNKGSSYSIGGGGVRVYNGTFTMSDGTISGNSVYAKVDSISGGGVRVYNGTFTMSGGTISDNEAYNEGGGGGMACGGGVYVNGGTFTMNGGTISGNKARSYSGDSYGAGVYIGDSGTFLMSSGTIEDNEAYTSSVNPSCGGGVFIRGGTFIMEDGTITRNKGNNGGAVSLSYNENSKFIMLDGEISGNNGTRGGAVYITNAGSNSIRNSFTMSGGEISSNTSNDGGGVYVLGGDFNMEDGAISNNSSYARGGGVYIFNHGIFNMSGGTVYGVGETLANNSNNEGKALYVYIDEHYEGIAKYGDGTNIPLPGTHGSNKYTNDTITGRQ